MRSRKRRVPVQPETNGHEMNFRMAELAEDQFAYDTKTKADALAKRLKDFSAATKKLDSWTARNR